MGKTAFETICENVIQNDKISKFKSQYSEKNKCIVKSEDLKYEIFYDIELSKIVLKLVTEDSERILSSWLLEESSTPQRDIQMISNDFIEIIFGANKTFTKKLKKKASKDESNITGLFFANRMVNIFPDIKQEIYIEKACYTEFRAVHFTKEILLPKINKLLSDPKHNIATIKKLAKLLSELYSNATLDVRSIITMCIFNNLENNNAMDEFLSEELKKAKEHALKYKGKKVKPEKEKKKTTLLSKALEYQQQTENQK